MPLPVPRRRIGRECTHPGGDSSGRSRDRGRSASHVIILPRSSPKAHAISYRHAASSSAESISAAPAGGEYIEGRIRR